MAATGRAAGPRRAVRSVTANIPSSQDFLHILPRGRRQSIAQRRPLPRTRETRVRGRCDSARGERWLQRQLHRLGFVRSEEHTSELQSLRHLVCRLLLEKKKKK